MHKKENPDHMKEVLEIKNMTAKVKKSIEEIKDTIDKIS